MNKPIIFLLAALLTSPAMAEVQQHRRQKPVTVPAGVQVTVVNRHGTVTIKGASPTAAVSGLVLHAKPNVHNFVLEQGIFTKLVFRGTTASDSLKMGSQAVIVTKGAGITMFMGNDQVKDTFEFTNTINVERISKQFGRPISPLNHLSHVVIKQFGPQDEVIIQGKRFTYNDVQANGTVPGIEAEKLRIEKLTGGGKDRPRHRRKLSNNE